MNPLSRPAPLTFTAQPREHVEIETEISIQILAVHPELLSRYPKKRKKRKKHEDTCECDQCESVDYNPDLDFT